MFCINILQVKIPHDVISIITICMSPERSLADILCLLRFLLLLWLPSEVWETYYFCSISYYYITPTVCGWCIVILCLFFTIILILPHIFACSISRRCLDQILWNLVGISYAMWSCALKGWFFLKMAAVAMEMAKMLKKIKKTQKWS